MSEGANSNSASSGGATSAPIGGHTIAPAGGDQAATDIGNISKPGPRGELALHMDHIIQRLNSNLSLNEDEVSGPSEATTPTSPTEEGPIIRRKKRGKLPNLRIYKGTFIHSTASQYLQVLRDCIIGVQQGKIVFIENASALDDLLREYKATSWKGSILLDVPEPLFFMPGLVDLHAHAFPYFARGVQDLWMKQDGVKACNRRQEKLGMIHDDRIVKQVIKDVLKQSLHHGTTAAAWHGTSVESAAVILANFIDSSRQRGQVGIDFHCDQNKEDVQMLHVSKATDCTTTISRMHRNSRVTACVIASQQMPDWLEKKMATTRKLLDIPLKTNACGHDGSSGLHRLDQAGLLDEKTLLTNCLGLAGKDINLMSKRGSSVVHCPSSDYSSPQCRCIISDLLKRRIPVGLGSDLLSSNSLSMIEAIRNSVLKSRQQRDLRQHFEKLQGRLQHLENEVKTLNKIIHPQTDKVVLEEHHANGVEEIIELQEDSVTYEEAFYMATLGGATVLGIDHHIGSFEEGKDFDALLIHPSVEDSAIVVYPPHDDIQDVLQKFLFTGDDRNILQVYIAGERVK